MSVSIKYKGAEIASASTEVTKTIKTAGKYCEADILVENTPDGGDAPVINPLSVTENGTYTAPSGVDGYSPVTVNVPQGITPTGNINITDTNPTDVTNYATATVVDADLVAENIKKDVNILGVVGSFEGGGGEGVEVFEFTPAENTAQMILPFAPTSSTFGILVYAVNPPTGESTIKRASDLTVVTQLNSPSHAKYGRVNVVTAAGGTDWENASVTIADGTTTLNLLSNAYFEAGKQYRGCLFNYDIEV